MFVSAPTAFLLAGQLDVLGKMYLQENLRLEATVPWNSQGFWPTHERVELLGDSHLEVETRSRDLDTVNNSRL